MTHIVKCTIENIMGVKKVEMKPDGKSVTIGGANGEGKSSTIWALIMALGGKTQMPKKPVRKGQDKGTIVVELDKLIVTAEISSNREAFLKVQNKDGKKFSNAQTILDSLFGNLSFDPGGFKTQDKDKRFKILVELLGIDPSDLEAAHDEKYDKRTEIGRDISKLEGKIDGRSFYENLPDKEIDVSSSLEQLRSLQDISRELTSLKSRAVLAEGESKRLSDRNERIGIELGRLAAEIERLKQEEKENHRKIALSDSDARDARNKATELEAADDSKEKAAKLDAELADFNETNRKIRENQETVKLRTELAGLRNQYGGLTAEIKELDERMQQIIASAKTPIPGLTLGRGVVYFNDVPFEQISESEQWEVSTAIGFALNQKSILFMKNCGGLDRRSRDRVRARAAELGVQLFLEVVDDADDVQILIEEGVVKENRLEESAEVAV